MKQGIIYKNHYKADKGKIFICKETGEVAGYELWLTNGQTINDFFEVSTKGGIRWMKK